MNDRTTKWDITGCQSDYILQLKQHLDGQRKNEHINKTPSLNCPLFLAKTNLSTLVDRANQFDYLSTLQWSEIVRSVNCWRQSNESN